MSLNSRQWAQTPLTWVSLIALWFLLTVGTFATNAGSPTTLSGVLARVDMDNEGRIAHEYSWELVQGETVHVHLRGAFDAYLELFDSDGEWVGADDDSGGGVDAQLVYTPEASGVYRLVVTSAAQDETGSYTLEVRVPQGAAPAGSHWPTRVQSDVETLNSIDLLPFGTLLGGRLEHPGEIATYALDVADVDGGVDVWLLGESDFDLYATAVSPDGSSPLVEAASESSFGYEHVRMAVPTGTAEIYLQVVLFGNRSHNGVYYLTAETWMRTEPSAPGHSQTRAENVLAATPLGGAIAPGERFTGLVNTQEYATQFWTVTVPEGVRRVSVGLFEAEGDLDISVHPGWSPGPTGFGHLAHRVSKRHNERVHLEAPSGSEAYVPPGLYTVAVWSHEPWPSEYEIEVTFDAPLPSSVGRPFTPPAGLELSGVQQAQLATVRIENDFIEGLGALVTPDGLILTPYHVVATNDSAVDAPSDSVEHIISLLDPRTGRATQRFAAQLLEALPQYDLALLEITADVDGWPWPNGRGMEPSVENPAEAPLEVLMGIPPVLPTELPFVRLYAAGPNEPQSALKQSEVLTLGYDATNDGGRFFSITTRIGEVVIREGRLGVLQLEDGRQPWPSGGLVVDAASGALIALTTGRHLRGLGLEPSEHQYLAHSVLLVPESWRTRIESRGGGSSPAL